MTSFRVVSYLKVISPALKTECDSLQKTLVPVSSASINTFDLGCSH